MNLKEMIIDATKYSLKGRLEFLFLGILLVSINIILYLINEFHILWILIIPFIIFTFFELGYLSKIVESTIWGNDDYPKFESYKNLLFEGIKGLLIFIIYMILPFCVLLIISFSYIYIYIFKTNFIILMAIIFAITLYFSLLLVQIATIYSIYNNSKFKAAFEFNTILKKFKNMNNNKFVFSIFIVFTILFLIKNNISNFSELNIIISLIVNLTIIPFLTIFVARFIGLLGRYYFKNK